ncbi:hypothetical protein HUN13_01015 [Acinetobacter seifertii]|uniref:hypothetical protein n=1 Tax=Acinetobacter seifertii TaxID=1530123 RepID=UPI00158117DD|nr:hypothetical protein [Acinetobacter seifertii]NUG10163.1 hypothetical protein [Acinetobacter seifertii]
MKAQQFIKDHGLEKAREVVEGAPECGQPLYFNTTNGVYLFTGYRNTYFVNGVWGTEDDHPSMQEQTFKAVSITQLKSLVESVDLVNDLGGMEKLTPYFITTDKRLGYTHVNMAANGRICFLDEFCDFIPEQAISIKRVMEAIKAYASIYGEE